jgi:hypothetical protein
MHEPARMARERIIATEILKLERREALVRSQRQARTSSLVRNPDQRDASAAGIGKEHR